MFLRLSCFMFSWQYSFNEIITVKQKFIEKNGILDIKKIF